MYLEAHQIMGTDKPIFKEKGNNHLTLDEILHLDLKPKDYVEAGFVRVIHAGETLFKTFYTRQSS